MITSVLLSAVLALALSLTIAPVTAAPARVGSYIAENTSSATENTKNADLGWFPAGTTVRVGTCSGGGDLSGAWYVGDTFLRLFRWNASDWVEITAADDDGGDCGGIASYISYTLPYSMRLQIRAGCYGSRSCQGLIFMNSDMDSNGTISNVINAFANLNGGIRSAKPFWYQSSLIPDSFEKPCFIVCVPGRVHFQGVARLRSAGPDYYHASWFAISGSGNADLFFVYLSPDIHPTSSISNIQGPADQSHSSVRLRRQSPARISDGTATHFGGLQAFGHYLAVGLEQGEKSHIQFWEVNDPYSSQLLHSFTGRETKLNSPVGGAGAVGIAKAPGDNQGYIMAVGGKDSKIIDFYRNPANSYGYASPAANNWSYICSVGYSGRFEDYFQNINLVYQDDGRLFLIGTRNDGEALEASGNRAQFYELTWDGFSCYSFTHRGTARFGSYTDTGAAFNAAAGIYVDADGDRLAAYSLHAYRPDKNPGQLSIVEFRR